MNNSNNKELKTNKQSVKDYHNKLETIRVRFPSCDNDLGIPDYHSMMKERAYEKGFIDNKTKSGSVNAYILDLIEKDLGIDMIKGYRNLKSK